MHYFQDKVVMVIEDDAGYRKLLESKLATVNAVVFSSLIKHAVDAFEQHRRIIDCILIGTDLPLGFSGFEVYDVTEEKLERKRVIFLASDSDRESSLPVAPAREQGLVPEPLEVAIASPDEASQRKKRPDRSTVSTLLDTVLETDLLQLLKCS